MGNKQGKLKRRSGDDRPSTTGSAAASERKRSLWSNKAISSSSLPAPPPPPSVSSNAPPAAVGGPKSLQHEPHPEYQPQKPSSSPASETRDLVNHTHFSAKEIESIRENVFSLLGYTLSQTSYAEISISKDDFMKFLGVPPQSLFPNRLFAIFATDSKNDTVLTFPGLVRGLSILSQKATHDEKLRMAFQLLDPTDSGYITHDATVRVLKSCLDESKEIGLTDDQIDKLVASTFLDADLNHDGVIDFAEYQALDARHPGLLEFLTVDSSGILSSLDKQKFMSQ
ncbi:hypothetical protein DYB25_011402 [Aphanomyces astaci]|uniref:EF-hand domain-containing protein n=2 Tax=Aphanomyces astaci TaxID=112090 RepID=A0A397FP83_APHAT|nr:hypothetical protein DYB25_011402 [Aphanomyces astaci]RHY14212.1 hypothetical protein DYB36_004758 [Aphanomyces astaci]RHY42977.1 hypothetical protein DYB34_004418 [Aphanomyces astaci]RHY44725.1 hypothetical protein DYB38_005687 [Aphanomyces astaci]RHY74522.1 hypothetical protein DYB30_007942 [Aphanomyces astaci]